MEFSKQFRQGIRNILLIVFPGWKSITFLMFVFHICLEILGMFCSVFNTQSLFICLQFINQHLLHA